MHRLIFFGLVYFTSLPVTATAGPIALELSLKKINQSLGTLDAKYSIPPSVLSYILATAPVESDKGQALLQLAKDTILAVQSLAEPKIADQAAQQILKSEFCVRFIFGTDARVHNAKIHALSLNHYESARLGIRLNTHIANALPYLPEKTQWQNECRFSLHGNRT